MKSNAIARIVIYALVILLLMGIFVAVLGMDLFISNTNSGTTNMNTDSFSAADISKLEIDWAAGSITIQTADTDSITVAESSNHDEKYNMVCRIDGSTLSIDYAKSTYVVGFGSMPEKDLAITVPEDWFCSSLEIDGAALEVRIEDINANSIELDGAAMEFYFTGSLSKLDCDGAACELELVCHIEPNNINIDGASCSLDLTLPADCGFLVQMEGLGCSFDADVEYARSNGDYFYGDRRSQVNVDGLSCSVTIHHAETELLSCAHVWDEGTREGDLILYSCTLCGETKEDTHSPPDEETAYHNAEALLSAGKNTEAAIAFGKLADYSDAKERSMTLWADARVNTTLLVNGALLVGIQKDGTLIWQTHMENPYPELSDWKDVYSIAAGNDHIVGLRFDGTVLAAGDNSAGQCNVGGWTDIVAVGCGSQFTVGLTSDGTVLFAGQSASGCGSVTGWTDIVMLEAAGDMILGLKCDGTAVALGLSLGGTPNYDDIIDISLHPLCATLLRCDGSIDVIGSDYVEDQNIPGLITAESDGSYLFGIMADGTTYADFTNPEAEMAQVVAVVDYGLRYLGLRSDGSVALITFYGDGSALETPDWTGLMLPTFKPGQN